MSGDAGQALSEWLALREPWDIVARSAELSRTVAAALPQHATVRVVDLGSGTGANLRYLTRFLPSDQEWLLVDKDAVVLDEMPRRSPASTTGGAQAMPTFDRRRLDLGARDAFDIFDGRDLVTASALLDLVSAPFLGWLAEQCRAAGAVALFALTYTGRSSCTPREAGDDRICALLNRHQRQSDKGFGPAAGPDAVDVAERAFAGVGYRVRRERSDWRIGPEAPDMQRLLIRGWRDAAVEMEPGEREAIADWHDRRVAHLDAGRSHIVVSHEDLAAFPR